GQGGVRGTAGRAGRRDDRGPGRAGAGGVGGERDARPSGRVRAGVRGADERRDRGLRSVDVRHFDRAARGRGPGSRRAERVARSFSIGACGAPMKVAILGATGAVGQMMLRVLEERGFPADEVVLLASERSAGRRLPWRGREWPVVEPTPEAFEGCALALFSAGATRSREWAPVAAEAGAVVVDNSSAWRMDPDVPLVVPEVNPERVRERPRGIIANPNCVTIQLVLALEGIRRAGGLRRVVVSTYQAVSGAG